MLSKRVVSRSRVILTYSPPVFPAPVVVARVDLGSFVGYGRSVSLYHKCCGYSGRISDQLVVVRQFASSVKPVDDSEYEIDYITLKKTKKKPSTEEPRATVESVVPTTTQFRINKKLVKTAIRQANEEIQAQNNSEIEPMFNNGEYVIENGDIKEVLSASRFKYSYNELVTLRKYLSQAHITGSVTNQQLLSIVAKFKQKCNQGVIPEVKGDDIKKFDNMCDYVTRLLVATRNPNFPMILENALLDAITYNAGVTFFQSGLVWFDKEILKLIRVYGLEEETSKVELIKYLEIIIKPKSRVLNEFHDLVYFRNKVLNERYRELVNILNNVELTLSEIQAIIEHPSYATYRDHIVSVDRRRVAVKAASLVGQWHLLASLNLIPKVTLDRFYVSIPLLSELASDSTQSQVLKNCAAQLLQGCIDVFIKDPRALQDYSSHENWFKIYSVSDQLQDDYLFSALVSMAIPIDELRTLDETKWKEIQEKLPGLQAFDYKYVCKLFSAGKISRVYCQAIGCPSYYCIPKHEQLLQYGEQLQALRTSLGGKFKDVDEKTFKKELTKEGGGESMKQLSEILKRSKEYFGNSLFILDDLVEDCTKHENVYKQIPDTISFQQYINEIKYLKTELNSFSDKELFRKQFEQLINDVVNGSKVLPSYVKYYNLIDLGYKLSSFCKGNSSNCLEVLDSVLINQDVFESYESSIKPKEYKQIPDDFFLEEYFVELCELKVALEVSKFENATTNLILGKIEDLANDEDIDVEKRIIWRKLYINLARLFKHNMGDTGVLDTVISSAFKFHEFETTKLHKKLIRKLQPSIIGDHIHLLRDNTYEVIVKFLDSIKVYDKLNREMFNQLCEEYITSLNENSTQYLFAILCIGELQEYNNQIENYPNFLNHLFNFIKSNPEKRMTISPTEIEELYKELVETMEYDKKQKAIQASKPIDTKFDIDEFKKTVVVPRVKYNNVETLLNTLNKQQTGADFKFVIDATTMNSVKQGVHSALHETDPVKKHEDKIVTTENKLEEMKAPFKQQPISESKSKPRSTGKEKVNTGDLESYLKQVKREAESRQRENEAFEWSKETIGDFTKIKPDNFRFILINMNGEVIPTDKETIDGYLPKENAFEALSNFDEHELVRPIRRIKKFQRKNWKLIGSKVDGNKKYFIMAKPKKKQGYGLYDKLKSVFAVTGLVLVGLVGVNFLLEDVPKPAIEEESKEKSDIVSSTNAPAPFTVTIPQDTTPSSRAVFGKEEFKDVVVDTNSESESNTGSSWWYNLLWSSK
ncbi:hypothetical protein JA1_002027 [Spathaspora sp. JA1]|nr:hypothetical protein JA1_002027 [Spathaspora sp. JA1]